MVIPTARSHDHRQQQFGNRVRELRRERGISQEKLAELSGVDRSYVSQIERGIRNVSLRNIYAVADGLGVHVGELFPPGSP